MTNAIDYLKWRGDISFDFSEINDVDLFIFSQLATPNYHGIINENDFISIKDISSKYFEIHSKSVKDIGVLQSKYVLPMISELANYERFKDIKIGKFVNIINNENNEQFSAITLRFDDNIIISIRGTDDTIVGWKEDCMLATSPLVPAQNDAIKYINEVLDSYKGNVYIVGHSKGGNLAIFGATNAKNIKRIKKVISFDGPGFTKEFLESDKFKSISDKVITIVSKNSTVGLIMNQAGTLEIVNTNVSGPTAHDGFTWEVLGKGFVSVKKLSNSSITFHNAFSSLLEDLTIEKRQDFINALFTILMEYGNTITDITKLDPLKKNELLSKILRNSSISSFNSKLIHNFLKAFIELETSEIKSKIKK